MNWKCTVKMVSAQKWKIERKRERENEAEGDKRRERRKATKRETERKRTEDGSRGRWHLFHRKRRSAAVPHPTSPPTRSLYPAPFIHSLILDFDSANNWQMVLGNEGCGEESLDRDWDWNEEKRKGKRVRRWCCFAWGRNENRVINLGRMIRVGGD